MQNRAHEFCLTAYRTRWLCTPALELCIHSPDEFGGNVQKADDLSTAVAALLMWILVCWTAQAKNTVDGGM